MMQIQKIDNQKPEDIKKDFFEHISDLKSKLILVLGYFVVVTLFAHYFSDEIISVILHPLNKQELIFLTPIQPVLFILKIDFLVGLICTFPILLMSIILYLKPLVSRTFLRVLYIFILISSLLLIFGIWYSYIFIIPISLKFLSSIVITGISNSISAQSYLNFFITQTFIVSAIFQVPLLIWTGIYTRLITVAFLRNRRRYSYLFFTVLVAIITPTTDIFNFIIVLVPALIVFEISIMVGSIIEYFRRPTS